MRETLAVEHDGAALHVEVEGPRDGPPLLLLHGLVSSALTWDWLGDELTAGRRVIRLDFRGHARSGHAPGTYDLAHYGGDAAAVLRATVARPAVVVGHSLGGSAAWWLAQHEPQLVAAALLEDPPLYMGESDAPGLPALRANFALVRANVLAYRAAGLSDAEVGARIAAERWGDPDAPAFGEIALEDGIAAIAFGNNRVDPGVIDSAIEGAAFGATDTTSPVSPPVLIVASDDARGAVFTGEHERRLAGSHPSVAVVRVAGAGHGIHDERAFRSIFAEQLRRFLDEHAPVA